MYVCMYVYICDIYIYIYIYIFIYVCVYPDGPRWHVVIQQSRSDAGPYRMPDGMKLNSSLSKVWTLFILYYIVIVSIVVDKKS